MHREMQRGNRMEQERTRRSPDRIRQNRSEVERPEARKRKTKGYFDYTLVFVVIFLMLFGLVMLYSASLYTTAYFKKQLIFAIVGIGIMLFVSIIDYRLYRKFAGYLFLISLLMVFMILTPLGKSQNGATRWLNIFGFSFQSAELFKIAVIILNASIINKLGKKINTWRSLLLFFAMALLEVLIMVKITENLSTGLIVGGITLIMFFVAYPPYIIFTVLGGAGAAAVVAFVWYVKNKVTGSGGDFRLGRILVWLYPEKYIASGEGFQTMQSLYAIGSGGIWGKGLGTSAQKMVLPEAENDMIFSIICEELGLVGAFIVIVMFLILLYRLVFIAKNSKDLFSGMLVVGVFAHFSLQVILNIAVVTNTIPPTGITLPFISYGGTAVLFLMMEIGIALNVSRHIRFR